jgi:hypothetical protein
LSYTVTYVSGGPINSLTSPIAFIGASFFVTSSNPAESGDYAIKVAFSVGTDPLDPNMMSFADHFTFTIRLSPVSAEPDTDAQDSAEGILEETSETLEDQEDDISVEEALCKEDFVQIFLQSDFLLLPNN